MQRLLISVLKFYQQAVSPHLKCSCRYYPTCSDYSIQAIQKYGCLKGIIKTSWRLLRCHPLSSGGIDFP